MEQKGLRARKSCAYFSKINVCCPGLEKGLVLNVVLKGLSSSTVTSPAPSRVEWSRGGGSLAGQSS